MRSIRTASHEAIHPTASVICDQLLLDYKPLICSFVTKTKGENSYMPPHQDWSFVDEQQFRSLNIWCSLVDVTQESGAIYLLRGSHLLPFTARGTNTENYFEKVTVMNFNTLTYLPMKAGQVLLYDHRMIHASPPEYAA
jgi:ectoine hydroxylase-related dioxygenase (phytanoyl-CoA dioxygenase family)